MRILGRLTNASYILVTLASFNAALFLVFVITAHYPPLLILLNVVSVMYLWCLLIQRLRILAIVKSRWTEFILIILLVIIAFLLRIYRVEDFTPGMYPDEVTVAKAGVDLLSQPELPPFVNINYGHPTPLLYFTGLALQTFGHSLTAIRLPSIVFGALSVGAFYILLRLFFPLSISLLGSVLMLFQYSQVTLSRLAYEPIPSLFWQIVSIIFLTLYWQKRRTIALVGLALSLGAGLYTYLAFRPFAAIVVIITILLLLHRGIKHHWHSIGIFMTTLFIAAMPLVSFYFVQPQVFSARSNQISIFSRQYSSAKFASELLGNMRRTAILPFFQIPNPAPDSPPVSGDPNPAHNPASSPMFDIGTVILALVGLTFLFRHNRRWFWLILLLCIPPFISDILSTELTPDTNYAGYGHPNALRASGFIWVVLFAATAGLYWAYLKWGRKYIANTLTVMGVIVLGICYWNWHLYFDQFQVSPSFYLYNYKFNHDRTVLTAGYLNRATGRKITMTKDLVDDGYVQFFLRRPAEISSFDLTSSESAMKTIRKNDITAIGVTEQSIPILSQMHQDDIMKMGYTINVINNPFDQPNIYIFERQTDISVPQL